MAGENYGDSLTRQIPSTGPGATNDATAKNPLGSKIMWKGEKYRYVLFNNGQGNVASADKGAAYWFALDPDGNPPVFTVTSDQTDSLYGVNGVAGVFGGIVTDGNHTYVKISGEKQVTAATGTAEGDKIQGSATDLTFGFKAAGTAPTDVVYGVVKEGSTSGGPTVLLMNLDW